MKANNQAIAVTGAFLILLLGTSAMLAEDVIQDLSKVNGIANYDGPEKAKALLKKNGFVVVPRFYHRIFSPYYKSPLPRFITADSVHRTFHVIFEDQLKKVEAAFAGDVKLVTTELLSDLQKKKRTTSVTKKEMENINLAVDFLLVAQVLVEGSEAPDLPDRLRKEIDLINAANGVHVSPLFGYDIDYSQFKPRGFYTESVPLRRYFKVMSWFGNVVFRLKSDRETRAAMELAVALERNRKAIEHWGNIDRTYAYLIAETDDLTPLDYASIVAELHKKGSPGGFLPAFRRKAAALRDPKISSMALSPAQMTDWVAESKGMRFLGKRYIPDSEIFMNLTDPKVAGRGFPSGLDMMAANGSKRARTLNATSPDMKMPGYAEGMEKSTAMLRGLKGKKKPSHYVELLKVMDTLTSPPHRKAEAFARTEAYADKSLMTALASWASLRHAWVLHAKQSVVCLGLSPSDPVPGYIEPNPDFFEAMQRVTKRTIEIFSSIEGVDTERFKKFNGLLDSLRRMLKKQFAGDAFTEEEIQLFDDYANVIGSLQGFDFNMDADRQYPWMALISDIHTELQSGKCLQVGTGAAMPIYVTVQHKGVPHLLMGAIYSYYEFKQPIAGRLTDEEWRGLWDAGRMPRMPLWTSSFVAGHDVDSLIRKARRGERVEELLYVDDPRVDAFLEEAMKPSSGLAKSKTYGWILYAAACKLQRKAVPTLLDLLRTGDVGTKDAREQSVASSAAQALSRALSEEDVPALLKISLSKERERAKLAVRAGGLMSGNVREKFLAQYFSAVPEKQFERDCLDWLDYKPVSKDITGELLDTYKRTKDSFRKDLILDVLTKVWAPVKFMDFNPQPAPHASGPMLEQWEKEIRAIVIESIQGNDKLLRSSAARLSEALKIEEAILHIEKNLPINIPRVPYTRKIALTPGGACSFTFPNGKTLAIWCDKHGGFLDPFGGGGMSLSYGEKPFKELKSEEVALPDGGVTYGEYLSYIHSGGCITRSSEPGREYILFIDGAYRVSLREEGQKNNTLAVKVFVRQATKEESVRPSKVVDYLVSQLKVKEPAKRIRAIKKLHEELSLGDTYATPRWGYIVEQIRPLNKDPDPNVRKQATSTLRALGDLDSIMKVISPEPTGKALTADKARGLGQFTERSKDINGKKRVYGHVKKLLGSQNPELRAFAVNFFTYSDKLPEIRQQLIDAQKDPSPKVRQASVLAMAQVYPEEEIPKHRIPMLDDESDEVVITVMYSSIGYGMRRALPIAPVKKFINSSNKKVRLAAIHVVGFRDCKEAEEILLPLTHDKDREIKDAAICGLYGQRSEKAYQRFLELMKDSDPSVRIRVLEGLYYDDYVQAIPHLREFIKTEGDKKVLQEAKESLSKLTRLQQKRQKK